MYTKKTDKHCFNLATSDKLNLNEQPVQCKNNINMVGGEEQISPVQVFRHVTEIQVNEL